MSEIPTKDRKDFASRFYAFVTGDRDEPVSHDIAEEARDAVPENFLKQLLAYVATKTGDALSKPGLILTWLLSVVGAPAAAIGVLVPVREAGSLLPQLIVSGAIRRFEIRKGIWAAGSVFQGLAVIGMAAVAMTLNGAAAGWSIIGLLAVFSLSRGVCSIVSKDLIGKTIPKTRRGRLSGWASSISGWIAVVIGIFFILRNREEIPLWGFALLLTSAGVLWLAAAALMASLNEKPGATTRGGSVLAEAIKSLRLLKEDRIFRRFCVARALLASTVLSMPFYVVLASTLR